jgi:hypothetical protein
MLKRISIFILFIILLTCPVFSVEISHDGMSVPVLSGGSATKVVTFLNREEVPGWVRISLSAVGPLSPEKVIAAQSSTIDASALGWTQVKQGWVEIPAHKIVKFPVQVLPSSRVASGQYSVWLVIEQVTEKPKAMTEEQRGGAMLETQAVDTYYLPVVVNVSNSRS